MLVPLLWVSFALLLCIVSSQDLCETNGICPAGFDPSASSPASTPVDRAVTCPATDCNTGVFKHHGNDVNGGTSLVCNDELGRTFGFSYLRCFAGALCPESRHVDAVRFMVRNYEGADVSLTLTVNIYVGDADSCNELQDVQSLFTNDPRAAKTVDIAPNTLFTNVDVVFDPPLEITATESILVEVSAPSLIGDGGKFSLGDSGEVGQCDPSYVLSADCSVLLPIVAPEAGKSFIISALTSPIEDEPTDSPVASPTGSPVASPTGSPVASPTGSPVASPTDSPVAAPPRAPSNLEDCFVSVVGFIYCILGFLFPDIFG